VLEHEWAEKLAIQELCARYCHTIDSQDSEGWAQCFTPDGVFEFDGWAIRGRPALAAYAEVHARVMRCHHAAAERGRGVRAVQQLDVGRSPGIERELVCQGMGEYHPTSHPESTDTSIDVIPRLRGQTFSGLECTTQMVAAIVSPCLPVPAATG
jgi:hypothetical protein